MSQSVLYDTYYPVKSSSRMTLMWIPHQAKKKKNAHALSFWINLTNVVPLAHFKVDISSTVHVKYWTIICLTTARSK